MLFTCKQGLSCKRGNNYWKTNKFVVELKQYLLNNIS